MAGSRKLQAEITQCLKKIEEGMGDFDAIWEKVYSADTQAHKERWEAELKKEIKKLQRFRDQIKGWLSSPDIKDKAPLIEARKNVEGKMEQFKICERETKTKAYSREGLAREAKVDPREADKEEKRAWLGDLTDQLSNLVEVLEADLEKLQGGSGGKKGRNREAAEVMSTRIKKNKWHILKLEQIKRLMDNDELEPSAIEEIREDVDYYVESAADDDGNTTFDDMLEFNIYETLNLDANPLVIGMAVTGGAGLSIDDSSSSSSSNAADNGAADDHASTDGKPVKSKRGGGAASTASAIAAAVGVPVPLTTGLGASPAGKGGKGAAATASAVAKGTTPTATVGAAKAPAPATAAAAVIGTKGAVASVTPSKTASAAAPGKGGGAAPEAAPASAWSAGSAAAGADGLASSRPTAAAIVAGSATTASAALPTTTTTGVARAASAPEPASSSATSAPAPDIARSASVATGVAASTAVPTSSSTPSAPAPVPGTGSASQPSAQPNAAPPAAPAVSAAPANVPLPPRPAPAALSADLLVSLSMLGFSSAMSNPPAPAQSTTSSTVGDQGSGDKAPARAYAPRTPHNCHSSFPQVQPPASICENPKLFERFNYDTLFLVFYYQQGSYQQYLAAKQLKKLGWRYHKKYMTWFQRHEEPKAASEEGEEGTYIYFDYEAGWCQRIKPDFKFEYAYLEDEI